MFILLGRLTQYIDYILQRGYIRYTYTQYTHNIKVCRSKMPYLLYTGIQRRETLSTPDYPSKLTPPPTTPQPLLLTAPYAGRTFCHPAPG